MAECSNPKRIAYKWTEGDTAPEIGITLPSGLLVADFTITMNIERPDGTTLAKPVVDLGGSQGKFTWSPTDLIEGLGQRAKITRVDGGGLVQSTMLFLIDVDAKVGP